MTTEQLKRAQELIAKLEAAKPPDVLLKQITLLGEMSAFLREMIELSAQTAEPVAWLYSNGTHWSVILGAVRPDERLSWEPLYTHPAKTEQPSLSDAEIEQAIWKVDALAMDHGLAENQMPKAVAIIRALLSAQRQDSDKDAERYRKAIAYEDNAGLLYCAVMNHCPDKAAIDAEFDAEAIDVGAIANGAPK